MIHLKMVIPVVDEEANYDKNDPHNYIIEASWDEFTVWASSYNISTIE